MLLVFKWYVFSIVFIDLLYVLYNFITQPQRARLAQSVEHETLNLRVVGSSPTSGVVLFFLSYTM